MRKLLNFVHFSISLEKGPMLIALKLGPLIAFVLRLFFFRDEVSQFKDQNVFLTGAAPSAKKPIIIIVIFKIKEIVPAFVINITMLSHSSM